mmetsp:Transcript_29487/g.69385  ORF Transcript_29487/g.69385 Transcript_29487/m.69385 type:complete len:232 (+) Transcript_29487:270-965(+)
MPGSWTFPWPPPDTVLSNGPARFPTRISSSPRTFPGPIPGPPVSWRDEASPPELSAGAGMFAPFSIRKRRRTALPWVHRCLAKLFSSRSTMPVWSGPGPLPMEICSGTPRWLLLFPPTAQKSQGCLRSTKGPWLWPRASRNWCSWMLRPEASRTRYASMAAAAAAAAWIFSPSKPPPNRPCPLPWPGLLPGTIPLPGTTFWWDPTNGEEKSRLAPGVFRDPPRPWWPIRSG